MTRRKHTDAQLREELRVTLDLNGWHRDQTGGDLAVDMTLDRIAANASDDERKALSARLWAIWNLHFAILGAG